MKAHNEEAVRVIAALGGTCQVARMCGVKAPSVTGWKRQGIPKARQQYLRLINPAAFDQKNSDSRG